MDAHLLVDWADTTPPRHSDEAEGYRPEPQADEPPSQRGHYVILPLRKSARQDLELPAVQTDPFVKPTDVVALGLGIRQEDLRRTGLEDDVATRGVHDVRHALAHENHRGVLLPQSPEPALHRVPKKRVERRDPRFLDDEQRGRPFLQALLDSVKEVEKDRHEMLLPECHQMRHVEDLEPPLHPIVGLSVEAMLEGPAPRGRRKRRA